MQSYFKDFLFEHRLKYSINYICIGVFLIFSSIMYYAGFITRSNTTLLAQISYSIILAVSLNLVVGFLGELSLGHAGFMCVGAYLGCYVANILHQSMGSDILILIITMIVGGLCAAVFGFIIGLPALRLKGDYLAIVTLAFGEIVRTVFKNSQMFGGAMGLRTHKYGETLFIPAFIVVIIMLVLTSNLIRSKHGRAITAIRDNEIAAKAMGINVTFYKLFVFVIAAFFAGIAGAIYGHYATPVMYSFFSYNYSIEILVMVVLGGIGSMNGSIIAATLITFINFQLTKYLSGNLAALKFLIYALILISLIIFNNSPTFAPIKAKLNIGAYIKKKRKKEITEKDKAKIKDDAAAWDKIPTKIDMDAILSLDVNPEKAKGSVREKGDK